MTSNSSQGPDSLRALLRTREFGAYFVARESAWAASAIVETSIGWQVYALTHNAFAIGFVGLIWFLPQLLFAIPAGMLADRIDRRAICVAVSFTNLACSIAYVTLAHLGVTSMTWWYGAFAIQGISYAVGAPAQRSILAQIVSGTRFVRASAFTSSIGELVGIGAPAIAGLLIAVSVPLAFIAGAIMQLASALGFLMLTRKQPERATAAASPLREALGGLHYIWKQREVLGAISLDLFAVLFGGATALLPIYATQVLHVGATGFGLLRAAPGLGAAVVAVVIARKPLVRHGARWLFWCVAGFGLFTIVFGLSKSFALSLVALALLGGCDEVSVVIRTTLVQLRTPDAMRGRVSAVENIFIGASNELGAFESGTLASLVGAVPSVVAGGVATLAVIALWAFFFPSLRKLDDLVSASSGSGAPVPGMGLHQAH